MSKPNTSNNKCSKSPSLTKRAALTNINGLIEQFSRIIIGFIISPLIIQNLGAELYGAWSMITQIQGYFALSDFRGSGTLKTILIVKQHDEDSYGKKKLVGASLLVWVISLGILFIVGLTVLPWSTQIIQINPQHSSLVHSALLITIIGLAVSQLAAIPANILRGCNLDFTSLGIRTLITFSTSLIGLGFVIAGFSLPGLAISNVIGVTVSGLMWLYLVNKHVFWFGSARPQTGDFQTFLGNSAWSLLVSLGQVMIFNSDAILVGILLDTTTAGRYIATGSLIRFCILPVVTIILSSASGLGGICGRKDWARVSRINSEISILTTMLCTVMGVLVIILNESFIQKWVGVEFFTGQSVNSLLVIIALAQCFYRIQSTLIDGLLAFKEKAKIIITSGLLTIGLACFLAPLFGLAGVAVSILSGTMVATVSMSYFISRTIRLSFNQQYKGYRRGLIVALIHLLIASNIHVHFDTWSGIIISGGVIVTISFLSFFLLGITSDSRSELVKRVIPNR